MSTIKQDTNIQQIAKTEYYILRNEFCCSCTLSCE